MTWRIATVDMGSNTLKFAVTEVHADGAETILHTHAETVRLSAGIATTGEIEPARRDRALLALQSYEAVGQSLGVNAFIGVATAALRMASNGTSLLDQIAETTEWDISVISGSDEARLTFVGLGHYLPASGDALLVDIGGGSTEVIHARNRQMVASESLSIGSGTLSDRCFRADPPGVDAVLEANTFALGVLSESDVIGSAIGAALFLSGGNGQFLSEVSAWFEVDIPFTPEDFPRLVDRLATLESSSVSEYLEIVQERARMLPAGAAIVLSAIQRAQPSSLKAVPSGIRGGLISDWMASRQS